MSDSKRGKRDKMIGVWCTQEEHDWIRKQGEESRGKGVSKGAYLRKVALGELPPAEEPFATNQQELKLSKKITKGEFLDVLYEQIPGATNNLNQMAIRLNKGVPADDKMVERLEAIKEDFNKISDIVLEVEG